MPEEGRPELESNGKYVKDIYVANEVVDKFWLEDSYSEYCKSEKGALRTLILEDCDERLILLMGSDRDTNENYAMECEVMSSDGSDGFSSDDEPTTRSVAPQEELDADDLGVKQYDSDQCNMAAKVQELSKEAEETEPMELSLIGESKSRKDSLDYDQDQENENVISSSNDVQQNFSILQQFSETIPYSGSISLRSTSSTASTRSFAFPVLAQEWDSSPVRMAEPDRRLVRKQKHRKLKLGWICCKF